MVDASEVCKEKFDPRTRQILSEIMLGPIVISGSQHGHAYFQAVQRAASATGSVVREIQSIKSLKFTSLRF